MVPLDVVLGLSIAINVALSAMLAIAWAGFGRPRHAAIWSAGHALVALQIFSIGALVAAPGLGVLLRPAIGIAVLGSGAFGLIGVRQRGGDRRWRDIALVAATAEVVAIGFAMSGIAAFEIATPGLVAASFTIAGALSLRPKRRNRARAARSPAEWVYVAALILLAAAKLLAAFAAASLAAWPWWPEGRIAYAIAFAIAIPLASIVAGIAGVLLIASDLADDLHRLAAFDPLTDVHNRRGFADAARRAIAVAQRRGLPVAVALADVDRFKAINDAHGHGTGDATLIAVARHFAAGVRNGDTVARLGGDEFAFLLIDLDAAAACDAVERIRAGMVDGVTASFGVATIDTAARSPDALLAAVLERADRALYRAKTGGRDRVVCDAA